MSDDVATMLADTAGRVFGAHAEALESGAWHAPAWEAIEESGLTLALVPEAAGGFGLAPADALGLIRLAGYHALPLPLAETIVANAALAAAGLPLAEGPAALAPEGDTRIAWGRNAATVVAEQDGRIHRLPAQAVASEGGNVTGQPRDALTLALAGEGAARNGPSLRTLGALTRALQMAGALDRVLELTIEHVSTRVQFGRTLSKFQAIQQELAKAAGEVAAASAAADHAADAYADGDLDFAVAVARARIGEAAGKAVAIAHQLHGAIGYTREHSLQRYTTALWAWRDEFGTQREWTREVGRRALSAGRDGYWPMVVAA